MADIIFLATIVAFFLLCVGYVSLCGRIIGSDDAVIVDDEENDAVDEVRLERAAWAPYGPHRRVAHRQPGRARVDGRRARVPRARPRLPREVLTPCPPRTSSSSSP